MRFLLGKNFPKVAAAPDSNLASEATPPGAKLQDFCRYAPVWSGTAYQIHGCHCPTQWTLPDQRCSTVTEHVVQSCPRTFEFRAAGDCLAVRGALGATGQAGVTAYKKSCHYRCLRVTWQTEFLQLKLWSLWVEARAAGHQPLNAPEAACESSAQLTQSKQKH